MRVEDARFQQLVVNYKRTVLTAQKEVEYARVAYTRSMEEQWFLKASVDATERSVYISLIQYREGIVDYQRVLDSQRFLATQTDRLTEVSGQIGTNLVATYKALGGGWELREVDTMLSDENRDEMIERTNWGGLLDPEKLETEIKDKDDLGF